MGATDARMRSLLGKMRDAGGIGVSNLSMIAVGIPWYTITSEISVSASEIEGSRGPLNKVLQHGGTDVSQCMLPLTISKPVLLVL